MQTGASALLAAAAVATLYGLVRFFDLFRREPSVAAEPQRIDFTSDGEVDLSTVAQVAGPVPTVDEVPEVMAFDRRLTEVTEADVAAVVPIASQVEEVAPAKAPRKGGRRTANTPKKSKISEAKLPAVESVEPVAVEAVPHVHVAPLFEPDPYHRMQRQGFGRRGRI